MDDHRQKTALGDSLPTQARLPINHCNLPPQILGSLTYQQHPVPLFIDGVQQVHQALFETLDRHEDATERAGHFTAYMRSGFLLNHPELAGGDPTRTAHSRHKADYLRLLRGWLFDSDGLEGAVLKGWVESRFGLLPRSHREVLIDQHSDAYARYQSDCARGLYNTNALEAQLDLLYGYCQYELRRRMPDCVHLQLYRGVNRIDTHEILHQASKHTYVMLLNNLNSFSGERERADEFGDYVLTAKVPVYKLLYLPGLFPGYLQGEQEHLVIGGVYQVELVR